MSTSSKRYFIGFQDYGGEGVDVSYSDKYLSYRLCYSLHSSFSEIADILKTLKPKRVTPIATPLVSQLTPKRLFQLIDYYIQKPQDDPSIPLLSKFQRKPINPNLQIKARYESFETKKQKKKRRKQLEEDQQKKDDHDALDLDDDNPCEQHLLQRLQAVQQSKKKKVENKVSDETKDRKSSFKLSQMTSLSHVFPIESDMKPEES